MVVARKSYLGSTRCITKHIERGVKVRGVLVGGVKAIVKDRAKPNIITMFYVKGREWVSGGVGGGEGYVWDISEGR